jgi:hypothetical protein
MEGTITHAGDRRYSQKKEDPSLAYLLATQCARDEQKNRLLKLREGWGGYVMVTSQTFTKTGPF